MSGYRTSFLARIGFLWTFGSHSLDFIVGVVEPKIIVIVITVALGRLKCVVIVNFR